MHKILYVGRNIIKLNSECLIKFEPKPISIAHKIYRFILGGSLPHLNQIYFHNTNRTSENVWPDIQNRVLIIKIDGTETPLERKALTLKLVYSICACIQSKKWHNSFTAFENVVFFLINAPLYRTLRELIYSSRLNSCTRIRLAFTILRINIATNNFSSSACMQHNDLSLHNILTSASSPAFLVDYEDSILEKKWIFCNLTDLLLEANPTLSRQSLQFEISRYAAKNSIAISYECSLNHATFGYIRFHVRRTLMKRITTSDIMLSLSRLNQID